MSEELVMGHAAVVPTDPPPPIAGGRPKSALVAFEERGISLRSMEDCFLFARAVVESKMAPRGFDSPQAVLVAIQFGAEIGLGPMAALQNVALVNGRPTLYGDAVPGVCAALVDTYKDEMFGEGDGRGCKVTITRKGRADAVVRTFTVADAKRAGLWGKQGPWSQYPDRMLLMRARTYAYRDLFPDALRGIPTVEEMQHVSADGTKNVTHSLDAFDAKPKEAA